MNREFGRVEEMTQAVSGETVDTEVQTGQEQEEQHETGAAGEQPGGEGGEQQEQHQEGEDDEVVVSLGDSPTPEEEESRAPEWVRELRKSNREKDRKLREQEAEIARLRGPGQQPAAIVVGEKPTLEGCNYDAAKFEAELEGWHERKREADTQQAKKAAEAKQQQDAWQATLDSYGKEKSELKVKDFEEAEEAVKAAFSMTQQGVVLHGVDPGKRAALVYALGKNSTKLKELASITDPVKFSFAVARLEMQLKVTPRKSAPPPERTVRSTVAGAAVVDNELQKLRDEAAKTGDLSKVIAFKNQKRQAGRG
jgi:hypothetical protein